MKKRLLKPPDRDGETMLFWSGAGSPGVDSGPLIAAHQPYFFHPGVALKFFLLHALPFSVRETLFVDTDRLDLSVNLPPPRVGRPVRVLEVVSVPGPLLELSNPPSADWEEKLAVVDRNVGGLDPGDYPDLLPCWERFRSVVRPLTGLPLLRETLARAFLAYSGLPENFFFFSDLIRGEAFERFFLEILRRREEFASIFNQALDDYRQEFRFRYRDFPFPALSPGELPFWRVDGGRRVPLFEKDIPPEGSKPGSILPRAATLTLFLRLSRRAVLIHGVGGANYEWIQDRLLERFFSVEPPPYLVVSGTFRLSRFAGRDFPYFFYPPRRLKEALDLALESLGRPGR